MKVTRNPHLRWLSYERNESWTDGYRQALLDVATYAVEQGGLSTLVQELLKTEADLKTE